MAVRSTRFFGGTLITVANTWVTLYTVPAGRTARFSLVTCLAGAACTILVGTNASGADWQLEALVAGGANVAKPMLQGMVLKPGENLRGYCTVANVGILAGFGSLLEGAPS